MLEPTPQSPGRMSCLSTIAPSSGVSGVLLLDKPEACTSFRVVKEVQKLLSLHKVGHCGTLDPFATGVLVLCLNRATRIADQLLEQDKVYRFVIRLGFESDTLDREGAILPVYAGPPLSEASLQACLDRFQGTYEQQVPRYAAVKVQGQRLYEWSRKGITIAQPMREVTIYRLRLLAFHWPEASLEVHCSKGTLCPATGGRYWSRSAMRRLCGRTQTPGERPLYGRSGGLDRGTAGGPGKGSLAGESDRDDRGLGSFTVGIHR